MKTGFFKKLRKDGHLPNVRKWNNGGFLAAALLLSGALSAQNGVSKQPLPIFENI